MKAFDVPELCHVRHHRIHTTSSLTHWENCTAVPCKNIQSIPLFFCSIAQKTVKRHHYKVGQTSQHSFLAYVALIIFGYHYLVVSHTLVKNH